MAHRGGHGPGRAAGVSLAGLRILLADGEPASRRRMQEVLEGAGCIVRPVCDGEEALEVVGHGWFFDLLVTDLDMRPMGGAALIRALRLPRPWLPVVLITAGPPEGAAAILQDRDEEPVLPLRKPAPGADLLDAVAAAWLGRRA